MAVTDVVETTNVAELEPAGIVRAPGTLQTTGLLLAIETETPLAGAEPVKLTVAVDFAPPTMEAGAKVKLANEAGVTVRVAVFEAAPILPVMIAEVLVETPEVVTAKVAYELPAGTSTDPGTVTLAFDELRTTTVPPDGAMPVNVTVPIDTSPPVTDDGTRDSKLNDAAATLRDAVFEVPFTDAMIDADWVALTGLVDTVNVAFFVPATIVTLAGTEAQEEPEVKETTSPPPGAADDIATVPAAGTPPSTDVGDTDIDETDWPKQVMATDILTIQIQANRTRHCLATQMMDIKADSRKRFQIKS